MRATLDGVIAQHGDRLALGQEDTSLAGVPYTYELLRRLRFRVTVNTDNRLMSDVTLSSEFEALDAANPRET